MKHVTSVDDNKLRYCECNKSLPARAINVICLKLKVIGNLGQNIKHF